VHPQIHPGVLREVMLARIAGDVAGALSLPLLRRKGDLGTGHAAAGPALSRAFPYHAYWNGDRHTQRLSLGLRHSTTRCAQS
jgi:hypothetical protein